MKRIFLSLSLCLYLFSVAPADLWAAQKSHTVFFEGEENELHVYRINGARPGKTLLIIGGIQGDEPGGFLAADFYVDFMLEIGNLIVVPRANFLSILIRERKINQDMNRTFSDDTIFNYESRVVGVLKKLICESDCFLNLHEGSGIYSPVWVSDQVNPKRFGQSIIADNAILSTSRSGETIDLKALAEQVIRRINQNIENPAHLFHFNNHRTNQPDSIHKEQLKSATYYAHTVCKIPAFGIESAKFLPLEQKVKQHIYAINAFMEALGIVPQTPGVDLKKPEMQYMIISVNGSIPVVVGKMQRLKIRPGDIVQVHDIVANYERGLSVDILGVGNRFNDMKRPLRVMESTRIEAKKDFYKCGSVFLDIDTRDSKMVEQFTVSDSTDNGTLQYRLRVNGKRVIVDNYGEIFLKRGDRLVIEDLISGRVDPASYIVNFKGFVGNRQNNSGEDRGYEIDTSKGVLMERYSLDKKGRRYYVLTTLNGKEAGKIFVNMKF